MKIRNYLIFVILVLTACQPDPDTVAATVAAQLAQAVLATLTAWPSSTPVPLPTSYPTYTPAPTYTPNIVIVTATLTPTPKNSPTPTDTPTITPTPTDTATPTITPTPTNTPDIAATATIEAYGTLTQPKRDGFYTVGTEILPGKWESTGTQDGCYWARYDTNQKLLGNHFGFAGGTITIRPTDAEIELKGCGRWIYVEGAERALEEDAGEPKTDGFYTVGVEIAPGKWESTGTGDGCYWARLDGNQNTIDNHFGLAGGSITIRATDYEVNFKGCGTWEYQGP